VYLKSRHAVSLSPVFFLHGKCTDTETVTALAETTVLDCYFNTAEVHTCLHECTVLHNFTSWHWRDCNSVYQSVTSTNNCGTR